MGLFVEDEPKPAEHDEVDPRDDSLAACRRCRYAAREGALRVHVMLRGEHEANQAKLVRLNIGRPR